MNDPTDEISYAIVCDKFPNPSFFFANYKSAIQWAKKINRRTDHIYILKCKTTYEICAVLQASNMIMEVNNQDEQV
jgi:ribosomal protein S8